MHTYFTGIKAIVFDFSRVLLFAKNPKYSGDLNPLHRSLCEKDSKYPFLNYFFLNIDLLDYLKTINSRRLIIFTSGTIQDSPAIQPRINEVFEAVYSAEKMGVHKSDHNAYLKLCMLLKLRPQQVLFIDDNPGNVDAASKAGLAAVQFTSNSQLIPLLEKFR